MISSGRYASTHGGLVIYLHEKWSYRIKNYETESQIWDNQIIEICDPTYSNSQGIIFIVLLITQGIIMLHSQESLMLCYWNIILNDTTHICVVITKLIY